MGDTFAADDPCVSCRTSSYTIQQLARLGLPVEHLADGTGYTLDELRQPAAFIPWGAYLTFLENSHRGVPVEQYVALCTSYDTSPYLRPLLTAAGLWFDPARYFEWVAAPSGALQQLFRCLETKFEQVGPREVAVEERLRPGFAPPPDLLWECQALGFSALTTHFGLGPSIVTWERIDRGAAFRVALPARRPVRTLLAKLAAVFRRDTPGDLRAALLYGHERSLRLEREVAARKRAEAAHRASEGRQRRIADAIPGVVYQYALEPDGTQGFTFVSGGAAGLTGYTPEELLADAGIIWRQVLPAFTSEIQASITASARNGTPWHQEFLFRTKGGDVRWVRGHSVPEPPDGSGRVVWNGILTDITAERTSRAALRDRDELLRKLSEQVPGVIYQFRQWPDGRSCFPYASEGIRSIYEVTPDEVRESAATVFARLHPDDLGAIVASITRSAETLEEWGCEYRVRLPVRGERWLAGHAMPERLPDGGTLWHGHISDITRRKRADEALRASETRFRHMAENIPGAIIQYTLRPDGTDSVDYMSSACDDVWEVPAEAVRADASVHWRMVHPEDVKGLRAAIADGARRLGPVSHSWRITTPSGRLKWLQVYARPEPLEEGSIRWNCAIFDVTAQKSADLALRESEERFRLASEAFQGLLYDLDLVTGTVFRSAGVADLIGYPPEEVPSDKDGWVRLIHPGDRDRVLTGVAAALAAGDRLDLEYRLRHRDGHYLDVWDRGQIVRGPDGAPVRIVGSTLDQTTRKRAEAALRESEERLSAVVQHTPNVAIQWYDADGRVVLWNAASEHLFGFPAAAATGKTLDQLIHTPEETAAFRAVLAEVGRTGRPVGPAEYHFRRADGAARVCLSSIFGIPGRGGASWFVCVDVDITERKQAEAALRESEERLRIFIENVPAGVVMLDRELRYLAYSRRWLTDYNLGSQDLHGRSHYEIFAEIPERWKEIHRRCLGGVAERCDEDRFARPDGSSIYLRWEIQPWYGATGSVGGLVFFTEVITQRVLAEAALRESEERFRTLIDDLDVGVVLLNPTDGITLSNPAATDILGLTPAQLRGMEARDPRWEIVREDETPFGPDEIPFSVVVRTRQPLRNVVVGARNQKTGARTWMQVNGTPRLAPDGALLHVILTFVDITARKQAEDELRLKDAAIAGSINAIAFTAMDGRLSYVNRAFLDLWGYDREDEVLGRSPTEFWHEPAAAEGVIAALQTVGIWQGELTGIRRDGTPFDAQVSANLIRDRLGRPTHMMASFLDITERKRAAVEVVRARDAAEEALARLKVESARAEQFSRLVEVAGQGIGIARLDGSLTYLNPSFRRLLELPPDADCGARAFWEFVPADLHPLLTDTVLTTTRDLGTWTGEFELMTATGRRVSILNNVFLMRDPDGAVVGYANIATDITERKRAECALQESESRQRLALDVGQMGTWDWDLVHHRQVWDARQRELLGFSHEEQAGDTARFYEVVHPEDAAAVRDAVAKSLASGEDYALEFRVVPRPGQVRWLYARGRPQLGPDRRPVRMVGINTDITARKQTEAALRDAEYRQRLALDAARMGTWDWDVVNGAVVWDARQQELFGFAPGEYDGHPDTFYTRVHPADAVLVRQHLEHTLATGDDYEAEFRAYPRPGVMRWVAGRGRLIRSADGRPIRVIGINYDRTDEKRTLLALEEAERHQRLALDAGRMGTWDWEVGTDRLDWDDREQALFGFPPGGFDGRLTSFLARVHPDDLAAVRQVLADAAAGKDFDGEFRIVRPTGEVRWIHGSGAVYPGNGDRPARLIGINYDVTDRVRAQEQLREANAVLQALAQVQREFLVAAAPQQSFDGLLGVLLRATASEYGFIGQVFHDPAGQPYLKARAITDISWDEATRRFYAEGAPAGLVFTNLNTLFGAALTSGRPVIANHPGTDPRRGGLPPGHPALNAFLGIPLFRGSEMIGMAGLANRPGGYDDSLLATLAPILSTCASLLEAYHLRAERAAAETALRVSLGEKEAMLKEIHHRVKNNLQVISSLLNLQAERITDPAARTVFLESQSRVRAMALVHETLYGSESLARIELPRYIDRLCDSLLQTFGGNERVTVERDIAPAGLELDRALPVGLIVSELVSNALKYAFPDGRAGRIRVAVTEQGDADLEVCVSDDGVGLPADLDLDRTPSLGLYLVRILTRQLRGTLVVGSGGAGVTFTLRFPK